MSTRVRFAPSPTGSPHVGNLRTAIFNWLFARATGGTFVARLEDTDRSPERYKPESVIELEEAMRFLGIVPDEWWVGGGSYGPYVQSERLSKYREFSDKLISNGKAYRCFCTKEDLEKARADSPNLGYGKTCRNLSEAEINAHLDEGTPFVVRLAVPTNRQIAVHDFQKPLLIDSNTIDDQVLMKSDGYPTYFLACAFDDIDMEITHIIRGDDWLSSAAKLVLLWEAMDIPEYCRPQFIHLPLIVGADRAKLSKRHGSTMFSEFIKEGYLPEALFNYLALLGWSSGSENLELMSVQEIVERFSLTNIQSSPAMFDYDKLKSFNGHYIRASPTSRIIGLARKVIDQPNGCAVPSDELIRGAIALEQEKAKTISEFNELVQPVIFAPRFLDGAPEKLLNRKSTILTDVAKVLLGLHIWNTEAIEASLRALASDQNMKFAEVVHPLRCAIFGVMNGPSLIHAMELLGKYECHHRIQYADYAYPANLIAQS